MRLQDLTPICEQVLWNRDQVEYRITAVQAPHASDVGGDTVFVSVTSPRLPRAFNKLPDNSIARTQGQYCYAAVEVAKRCGFVPAYADDGDMEVSAVYPKILLWALARGGALTLFMSSYSSRCTS